MRPILSLIPVVVLCSVARVNAQVYAITEIGAVPGTTATAVAADINDLGQIVGSREINNISHAFLWSNGITTDFGNESGDYTTVYASRINNVGQVIGSRFIAGGRSTAFLWHNGSTVELGQLHGDDQQTVAGWINDAGIITGRSGGHPFTWQSGGMNDFTKVSGASKFDSVAAINNWGVVAGSIWRDDEITFRHAAIWSNGETTDLGDLPGGAVNLLDGNYSVASAINDAHQVVGRSDGINGYHAFFWSDGVMTDLGALPGLANESAARDINNSGVVVGYSGDETSHAFRWDSINGMRDLNHLLDETGAGWVLTSANGINSHGQIVGAGLHNGQPRGYLLTPIPEPSTLAGAAVALACAAFIATRLLFRSGGKTQQ
jgi:probable HAF family extracellular repeat protein